MVNRVISKEMATAEEVRTLRMEAAVCKIDREQADPYLAARYRVTEYYDTLPIDDKLMYFSSQHGGSISGNVFHILKYVGRSPEYADYRLCLCTMERHRQKHSEMLARCGLERVELVTISTDEYFKVLASAKYLIIDNTIKQWYRKKPGQVLIDTWHGTPLKALGKRMESNLNEIGNAQKIFCDADYLTFPNEHTMNVLLKDYMVENIASGSYVMCGYPRVSAFYDEEMARRTKEIYKLEGKKLYAYLPTFRGSIENGGAIFGEAFLKVYLYLLDEKLKDDEIFYVNLHPISKSSISFSEFKHIKEFPKLAETYDFLNCCDALVTDYSSVFFDYAVTGRKIVLFSYDKETYLKDRGMYMQLSDFPFPEVSDPDELLAELRSPKQYDDSEFLKKYCNYEGPDTAKKLCDQIILGKDRGLDVNKISDNGRKNVWIYPGELTEIGEADSALELLKGLDTEKYNYIVVLSVPTAKGNTEFIKSLPKGINFFVMLNTANRSVEQAKDYQKFVNCHMSVSDYVEKNRKTLKEEVERALGRARMDAVVFLKTEHVGIEMALSEANCTKVIYTGEDCVKEDPDNPIYEEVYRYMLVKADKKLVNYDAGELEEILRV